MDLILYNGKIKPWISNPKAEAVAIKDGKFIKVGKNDEILELEY